MKNLLRAERYKFAHSGVLWTIIATLLLFALISVFTGTYSSAEIALRNIFKDVPVLLLGGSVYGTITLLEDFSNGLLQHYIAGGYNRASIICAKFVYYILGCCTLLLLYPLLTIAFTAAIRGIETSHTSVLFDFTFLLGKSLPLYLGIMGLFFLVAILFQNVAIAMAISVALSITLMVFPNMLYSNNVSFLKFTPMIQLSVISTGPVSVEYLITAFLSLCLLGGCLGGSIVKINQDQF